ncbi:MAG: MOSC N-terminal beta barrel domain-containing protein [Gammaproteobacteria bacterium]|nr:MOSC N-terminal beta barrel domain-containing protein [Gammaproteobacteria bacterium]
MPAVLQNIYRYPVKSMGGQNLTSTRLAAKGIPGDRAWALKDERGLVGAKRFPELMSCEARLLSEPSTEQPSPPVEIRCPDGAVCQSDDDQITSTLSGLLGIDVSLWPLMPEDQLDHYLRIPGDPNADPQAELRKVFARTADEPLPDLSQFPAEIFKYQSPLGTYFDAFPLLLMSTNSLAEMQRAAPDSQIDVRRFRPNLLFDLSSDVATADSGAAQRPSAERAFAENPFPENRFPENEWAGKKLRLGGATLKVEMECPRCIMTTHGFGELPRDPAIMRALVRANGGNLGVYATVLEPGPVQLGDALEII